MNKFYCTNCGIRLTKASKKCPYCEKKIITKRHPISDVLYDNIKEDLKDKTKDTFFDILANFIKSHLYGSILTLTIIGSVTASLISDKLYSPPITNSRPDFKTEIEKIEITDSKEFIKVFSKAIATGDEETIKAISYATHYPENYKKFYSETNTWILGKGNGSNELLENYNFLDYIDTFKNIGKYYVDEVHSTAVNLEEPLSEVDENMPSYFEDTKNIVLNGRAAVEGNMIFAYCFIESECEYKEELGYYNKEPDYEISTFYTIIKEDNNWYLFRVLSTDERFNEFKLKNGNLNELVKGDKK